MRSLIRPGLFSLQLFDWKRSAALLLVLVGVLLSSCRNRDQEQEGAADSRPTVLTTFTVLADLARNVAGDRLRVASIVKPGAEIHGYQPTPSDIERASRADLIVENGTGVVGPAFHGCSGGRSHHHALGGDGSFADYGRRLFRQAQSPCLDVPPAHHGLCGSSGARLQPTRSCGG